MKRAILTHLEMEGAKRDQPPLVDLYLTSQLDWEVASSTGYGSWARVQSVGSLRHLCLQRWCSRVAKPRREWE